MTWWLWAAVVVGSVVSVELAIAVCRTWGHDCGRQGCDIRSNQWHSHTTRSPS